MKCEACGCTDAAACEGGCSWDEEMVALGHAVCTRCTAIALKVSRILNRKKARR